MQKESDVLNQYMNICKDVLSEVEAKLSKSFKDFIIERGSSLYSSGMRFCSSK